MEGFGNPPLNAASEAVMKRPRSVASRKPRPKEQLASEYKDLSCLPSRSISPDDEAGEGSGHRRKELYLNVNGPEIRGSTQHRNGVSKKVSKQEKAGGDNDGGHNRSSKPKDAKHSTQGVLALACSRNPGTPDGSQLPSRDTNVPAENRIRKVKLKVSGLTRNIQTKPIQEAGDSGTPGTSDGSSHRHKHKDSGEKKHHSTSKDTHGNRTDRKRGEKHDISPSSDLVRKSKRVPKKRTLDSDDEDGELRYLEKLRVAKAAQEQPIATDSPLAYGYVEDGLRKKKLSKVSKNKSSPYEVDNDFTLSQSSRDGRKNLTLEDGDDFVVEDDSEMDEPNELKEADSPSSVKVETPGLTTRQRAGRGGHGESVIEYPDGLPAATSRKQKEKLPDVEIQARKAEVAQRRKMQVEKAEREQQAEAMRKILGIDTEKKKEERKQKEREDKEKQERFEEYKRSCIQCVMGPEGTVITFPDTMGIPSIFSSKPSSYPPPREKCAGPSCSNPYKYRDSKTKLPLCSLECYKAVQGSNQTQAC